MMNRFGARSVQGGLSQISYMVCRCMVGLGMDNDQEL